MRSLWKGIFNINLINNFPDKREREDKKKGRNITISPKFLGLNILIHNGKIYRRKYINKLMIKRKPKKLGEFRSTRKIRTL